MVTIPVDAKPAPLQTAAAMQRTNERDAQPLPLAMREAIDKLDSYINGMSRQIRCTATGTDHILITPDEPAPLIEGYRDYDTYVIVAEGTSVGAVTAALVTEFGTLATLKVYITNGATQAGAGDIVDQRLYHLTYSDHLDGGAGGLVRK